MATISSQQENVALPARGDVLEARGNATAADLAADAVLVELGGRARRIARVRVSRSIRLAGPGTFLGAIDLMSVLPRQFAEVCVQHDANLIKIGVARTA
jgi:hypothetical protein